MMQHFGIDVYEIRLVSRLQCSKVPGLCNGHKRACSKVIEAIEDRMLQAINLLLLVKPVLQELG